MGRLLVGLLLLYLVGDMASPFWPGAFGFDPDATVEARLRPNRIDAVAASELERRLPQSTIDTPLAPGHVRPASVRPRRARAAILPSPRGVTQEPSGSIDDH